MYLPFDVNIDVRTSWVSPPNLKPANCLIFERVQNCSFSGAVQHQGNQNGMPGIQLELFSTSSNPSVLQASTTDEDGQFEFRAVPPGRYEVRISTKHLSKYHFEDERRFVKSNLNLPYATLNLGLLKEYFSKECIF